MQFKFVQVILLASILPSVAGAACNTQGVFDRAAAKYGLDPVLLYSIALVESSANPNAVATNKNKSTDHGAMQINSVHLPTLERYGIQRRDLFNPCVNVDVGAWILKQCFDRWGVTWDGVGCYNSSSLPHRRNYAAKVQRKYSYLLKYATLTTQRTQRHRAAAEAQSSARASGLVCVHEAGCWVDIAHQSDTSASPLSPGIQ